jgi:hypothetical protein
MIVLEKRMKRRILRMIALEKRSKKKKNNFWIIVFGERESKEVNLG